MSSDTVPFVDSLASIYDPSILHQQTHRYKTLYTRFVSLYHVAPSHIVRAPGRVNLIVPLPNSRCNSRANTSIIPISPFYQWL